MQKRGIMFLMEKKAFQGAAILGTALLVAVPANAPIVAPPPARLSAPVESSSAALVTLPVAAFPQDRLAERCGDSCVGMATWYGEEFHGQDTASGEIFDMFDLTAAHRKLPLGTYVRVTNLQNRKWVVVRINDRGPTPSATMIDLSYAAAGVLGMRERGRVTVRLDRMAKEPDLETEALAQN